MECPLEDGLRALSREAAEKRRRALQPKRAPSGGDTAASAGEHAASEEDAAASRRIPLDATGAPDWPAASEDPLFVRKRAGLLADLVVAEAALARAPEDPSAAVKAIDQDEGFARAVRVALRECRKRGLASRVLDLSVCGAVAPYGPLLAGKLVALSVGSRDLREAYRARYSGQVSLIASQMAGREIRRPADYSALSTTSLYGVASSQYNRLALEVSGVTLRWQDLGKSFGYGTVHLSRATLDALTDAVVIKFGGRNVNYRFGEGNSPTLRQAREGLDLIVDAPNALLNHESPRRVYGFAVNAGALDALCLDESANPDLPGFEEVATAWARRWLRGRMSQADVRRAVGSMGPDTIQQRLAYANASEPQLALF
jgi:hypothetical protein